MSRAPGPKSAYGMRNLALYMRDPLRFLRTMKDRYGDFVEMQVLGEKWVLLYHPDDIESILVKHAKSVKRDRYVVVVERTLGKGLLTSEGDLWKRQRKLMSQAFTPKRIRSYGDTMVSVGDAGLPWRDGETIDLHHEMSRLTMEVVAAVLFGAGIGAHEVHEVGEAMEVLNEFYANSPEAMLQLPKWVPTPRNVRVNRAVERIDTIVYDFIAKARASDEKRDDLLGTLLQATDEGGGMSDQQLRDEVITLFLAGHETTALTLGYTLMLLGRYPDVEKRVVAELEQVLNGRLPKAEDSKLLPYTEMVIKEAMRLYPPAWLTGRETLEPVEIAGRTIPKGAQVLVSEWIVHRDPRFFPDPEAFVPERWEKDRAKALPKYAYFPFGGGPRVCIGNHFAMMEAVLLLAVVLQRYHLELVPNQTLELSPSITLRPKRGIRAVVKSRAERRATEGEADARPSARV